MDIDQALQLARIALDEELEIVERRELVLGVNHILCHLNADRHDQPAVKSERAQLTIGGRSGARRSKRLLEERATRRGTEQLANKVEPPLGRCVRQME